ncbi:type II secretion system protein GspL [Pseudoduganella armeniaca]|uniref:General secretion pathway protein GspL n=1 Tax=Pseudoduganella armeniaca TaxID=2072590 RepID=A0A2R4CHD8_9BURK|nr:type II secretion system protein GspL [Pseudoduganella armeniaca]AVR98880.1 general secretion pathway protein GspL [Pseudoduganella armeniaca]
MTTLYISYPARAAANDAGAAQSCSFALVGDAGNVAQQGTGALSKLADLVASARKVVLLLAASDVTLLRVTVPPLSGARLKAALPNLVEEQILGDPAECVLAIGPAQPGVAERTIAVVQRAWLEVLVRALVAQGARSVSALPGQLCLPLAPGGVSAALLHDEAGLELALRAAQYEGMGLTLPAQADSALHTLRALAGEAPVTLYVPAAQRAQYDALVAEIPGIVLDEDNWAHRIAAAQAVQLDLAAGLGAASGARAREWRRWRWPAYIALLAVLVNIAGLNIEWLRMRREADAVRQSMTQIFRAAYPNEKVILDPAAQMRKNIASAKAASGEMAADEFTALAAALGEALQVLPRRDVIAGLEYRDRALTVRLKPNSADAAALAQVQAQLAPRKLSLKETGAGVWQLRAGGGA